MVHRPKYFNLLCFHTKYGHIYPCNVFCIGLIIPGTCRKGDKRQLARCVLSSKIMTRSRSRSESSNKQVPQQAGIKPTFSYALDFYCTIVIAFAYLIFMFYLCVLQCATHMYKSTLGLQINYLSKRQKNKATEMLVTVSIFCVNMY